MEQNFFTSTTPLKGRVKHRYSDFIVEEVLVDGSVCKVKRFHIPFDQREPLPTMEIPERKNEEHLLVELEKINYDTSAALALLSRGLNVSKKRIGYAGLKDKRAITCQRISLYMPDVALVKRFGVKGLELRNPKWSEERIELGQIKGNNFTITIRDLSESEKEIKKILEEFKIEAEKGVPNFFGNQRFGGKRMITHKVGKLLLQAKFEEGIILYLTETYEEEKEDMKNARINLAKTRDYKTALREFPFEARTERAILNHLVRYPHDFAGAFSVLPKKIMYLFTHALQSHVYNQILEERLKRFGGKALEGIEGDVLVDGIPAVILPGYESSFAQGEAGEIEQEIMKKEGLTFESFKTTSLSELSSKGDRKTLLLKPENFKIEKIFEDEFNEGKKAATISFFLSKGNYATTILRELVKEEIF